MAMQDVFSPRHFNRALDGRYAAIDELERELERFTGRAHAVCVSSGTAALALAMAAYGTRGRAAVPAHTFTAIRSAMRYAGVDPVWEDCQEDWQTELDPPEDVQFLLPVHNLGCIGTHGIQSSVENWRDLNAPGAKIIVDCAAALLTPCAFDEGDAWCVSFNWNKPVSGGGGGAVITDDHDLAFRVRGLRRHYPEGGFNFQLSALCATEALNELTEESIRRAYLRDLSLAYDLELNRVGLAAYPNGRHRWLTGTMMPTCDALDEAMRALDRAGYACRRPWEPLWGPHGVAFDIYSRGLLLPGGYQIEPRHVREVCEIVGRVAEKARDDLPCHVDLQGGRIAESHKATVS